MNGQTITCTVDPPIVTDHHDSTPSIIKQGFKCELFNFGKADTGGVDYFNCGLVQRPDGLWLVARRSEHRKNLRIGFNDVIAFKLDDNLCPTIGHPVKQENRYLDEHFEDPRAIYHEGKTYVSCCDFLIVNGQWTGAHQIISRCNMNWRSEKRFDPVYGNNRETTGANLGHEKNWIWFFHNGRPHLLYQAEPHRVVRFNHDFVKQEEYETGTQWLRWPYGEIRGGTPPIRIGDEYWTFFHSSLKTNNKYWRRYFMGAYSFEAKPPFAITSITEKPLLIGSKDDPWNLRKPLVVFPCGSMLRDGYWTVTLGVNDLKCAWVEIPHSTLMKRTGRDTGFSISTWIKDRIGFKKQAVIAYLPPPEIGHTDIFLKNLREHPPTAPVEFISDHPWPGAHKIPDPTKVHTNKDKIASMVFLHALELAEQEGYDEFIYLETDCRVAGKGWDEALFTAFRAGSSKTIAGGNMAVVGGKTLGPAFKQELDALFEKHGEHPSHGVCDSVKIIKHGDNDYNAIPFVNGAPAVYSTRNVRAIVGNGSVEAVVEHMKTQDCSIGEICSMSQTPTEALRRFIHIPTIMATAGETIYPFKLRSVSLTERKVAAVHPIKNRWRPSPENGTVFYHSGDLGDIMYGLKAVQLYGGGKLVLGPRCCSKYPPRNPMSKEVFALYRPLLEQQPYLTSVAYSDTWPECTYDMNDFRELWNERLERKIACDSLCEAHCVAVGVEPIYDHLLWISSAKRELAPIVVHRSFRYREEDFPWQYLVAQYGKDMIFVGLRDEWEDFSKAFGIVDYYQPSDFANMAEVINGAKWVFANQSLPCAIAIGLGKNVWQERWKASPDCQFKRDNFFTQDTLTIDQFKL